jgi:hypothetical protein
MTGLPALLRPMGPGIWIVDGDEVRMLGIPFGTRMTVVKLGSGGLWVHSPVAPSPERVAALAGLGPIEHLVAPSNFHHLYLEPWLEHAPAAKVWAAPGLPERYPKRRFDEVLGDEAPDAWRSDVEQVVFAGNWLLVEVVFFHRPSRSLVITDIVQNHEPTADGWLWRTLKRINAIQAPKGGVPLDFRLTMRRRSVARAARDRMLEWPFEQVILTHGRCITTDARAHIERAFAWLR